MASARIPSMAAESADGHTDVIMETLDLCTQLCPQNLNRGRRSLNHRVREERRGDGEGVLGLPWSGWKAGMRSVRHWSVLRLNANCVCWRERGVMRVCAHDAHLVGGVCERVAVGRRAAQLQRVVKNLFN